MAKAKIDFEALKQKIPIGVLQEKITALPQSRKILLVLATLIVLGGGFYYFKYQGMMKTASRLQDEIRKNEARLADLKKKEKEIEKVREEVAKSREELKYYLTFLPDQKEIPVLLENISLVGSEVGLENILFQPQAEKQYEFYASVPIRLDLAGTYHQLGVFLDRISKMDRILKVEDLNLVRQANSQNLQVSCTLYTYRFSEAPPPPPKKK